MKRVLNVGSGSSASRQIFPLFNRDVWQEVRLDIDPATKPDVVGSLVDMPNLFEPMSFDAIWSSHVLEHLYIHQVPMALKGFKHVLKEDGFALITSPDIEVAASEMIKHGLDHVVYHSPAGPITTLDILFGHSASIAAGWLHMAHKTGFTSTKMGELLIDAGFATVLAKTVGVDLWAVALMDRADKIDIQRQLRAAGLDMSEEKE